MPGFGDTCLSEEQIYTEMVTCLSFCAAGPHAFLLVVPIGPYTEDVDQAILNLAKIFGDDAVKYHTVVLFTRGDELQGMEFDEYLRDSPAALRNLIDKCGGRYQVFNNLQNSNNPAQVQELLIKVDSIVKQSKSGFYSNAMFKEAEAIREEQRRIMLENKRRGSSGALVQMREQAVRSSRVLERLMRVVATGVIGVTVGIAFGVSVPLTAARSASLLGKAGGLAAVQLTGASAAGAMGVGNAVGAVVAVASGKTALALGEAAGGLGGGAIGVVAGSEAESLKEGASNTLEQLRCFGALALAASFVVGAYSGEGA